MEGHERSDCCSIEEAMEVLREHEVASNSRFAVYTSSKGFGETSLQTAKHVHWEDRPIVKIGRIEYSGVPFAVLGTKTFDCQFGKDRKKKAKETRKALKRQTDNDSNQKGKRFLISDSKKLNCEARCVMREVCHFPTFKIKDTDSSPPIDRKQKAQDLLYRLQSGEDIPHERTIIVCVPHTSQHTGHSVGSEEVHSTGTVEDVDSATETRDGSVVRVVEDEQSNPVVYVVYEDGGDASRTEKAAGCDTSLTDVVRSASQSISEKQRKPVACSQSWLRKLRHGPVSSRTNGSGDVVENGRKRNRKSPAEADQSERFLEIELKKLKHAEEALKIKKQKNVILQETLECNKRSAEALEIIAHVLKQQDLTKQFF